MWVGVQEVEATTSNPAVHLSCPAVSFLCVPSPSAICWCCAATLTCPAAPDAPQTVVDSFVSRLPDTARVGLRATTRATAAVTEQAQAQEPPPPPQQEPQQEPQHEGDSSNSKSRGVSLGLLLWPLTWLFPGLVAAHLAFAFAATAPLAAAWTLIAGGCASMGELLMARWWYHLQG